MKILNLTATNVKRLIAVDITPVANVVEITGRNGAGKSSVLDSIWWALAGTRTHDPVPIRLGANEAMITLDLGEIVVRRTFTDKENKTTTKIVVETADGARYPSPQAMLDSLLGSLTFDPLKFARAGPAQQIAVLREYVSGIDFNARDSQNDDDLAGRREAKRRAKDARDRMAAIEIPPAPVEGGVIDEADVTSRLDAARRWNAAQRAARATRDENQAGLARVDEELSDAQGALDMAQAHLEALTNAKKTACDAVMSCPAPEPMHDEEALIAELRRLTSARKERTAHESAMMRRRDHEVQAEEAETEATQLAGQLDARAEEMKLAISRTSFPVAGLTFTDDQVFFADLPLCQASDAERLRISCALAMSSHSGLRVLRVRDGSLLDDSSFELLREMAEANEYQIWIERVDTSGKIGIVIEDGTTIVDDQIEMEVGGSEK